MLVNSVISSSSSPRWLVESSQSSYQWRERLHEAILNDHCCHEGKSYDAPHRVHGHARAKLYRIVLSSVRFEHYNNNPIVNVRTTEIKYIFTMIYKSSFDNFATIYSSHIAYPSFVRTCLPYFFVLRKSLKKFYFGKAKRLKYWDEHYNSSIHCEEV